MFGEIYEICREIFIFTLMLSTFVFLCFSFLKVKTLKCVVSLQAESSPTLKKKIKLVQNEITR